VLRLNRTTNCPDAETDLATCPLPPPGERLPVASEPGRKNPSRADLFTVMSIMV